MIATKGFQVTNLSTKSIAICRVRVPNHHESASCQKKASHKGNHSFTGYTGMFECIKMKITWERKP